MRTHKIYPLYFPGRRIYTSSYGILRIFTGLVLLISCIGFSVPVHAQNPGCDFYEGADLNLNVSGGKIGNPNYENYYILTDSIGIILSLISEPERTFYNLPKGRLKIYALTSQKGSDINGIRSGDLIENCVGDCFEKDEQLEIIVCARPPEICGNGLDDDFDGFTDMEDLDCPCQYTSCPAMEGDSLVLLLEGGKIGDPDYRTVFLLLDEIGRIVSIAEDPDRTFYGLLPGDYYVYTLSIKLGSTVSGLEEGMMLDDIKADCYDIWGKYCFRVYPLIDPGLITGNEEFCFSGELSPVENLESPILPDDSSAVLFWEKRELVNNLEWSYWMTLPDSNRFLLHEPNIHTSTEYRRVLYLPSCDTYYYSNSVIKNIIVSQPLEMVAYYACPDLEFEGDLRVVYPEKNLSFRVLDEQIANIGTLEMNENGAFNYNPNSSDCREETFFVEASSLLASCLDTFPIIFSTTDTTKPVILTAVEDIEITCDEVLPPPIQILAKDNCPGISIDMQEISGRGYGDSCTLGNYTIQRTWVVEDLCSNQSLTTQTIQVYDKEAPNIFKVHFSENDKKIIGGKSVEVGSRWRYVKFPVTFDFTPLVFSQMIEGDLPGNFLCQIKNVSKTGFYLRITGKEALMNFKERRDVFWVAMENNISAQDFNSLSGMNISATPKIETLQTIEGLDPQVILFGQQTTIEADPVTVHFQRSTPSTVLVRLLEDQSLDTELFHSSENVGSIQLIEGNIRDASGLVFGEARTTFVDTSWRLLALEQQYVNPIVIANIEAQSNGVPLIASIKKVSEDSIYIKMLPLDDIETGIQPEVAHIFVMEGSVPGDICVKDPVFGEDFLVLDNCSPFIEFSRHDENDGENLTSAILWQAKDDCGNQIKMELSHQCDYVKLKVKMVLDGAMPINGEGLMRDDLRLKGLVPRNQPYGEESFFNHNLPQNPESLLDHLLDISGEKAIVDWILVELRNPSNNNEVFFSRAGLLCRNGMVMDVNGDSVLHFWNAPLREYLVCVKHRNHLAIQTKFPVLMGSPYSFVDFTAVELEGKNTAKWQGTNHQRLWMGNIKPDHKILSQGPDNDVNTLFLQVLTNPNNLERNPNYILLDYKSGDTNLDGRVIYQGPNNDRAPILFKSILLHPANYANLSNFMILDALP
jgi:hypothetical protein